MIKNGPRGAVAVQDANLEDAAMENILGNAPGTLHLETARLTIDVTAALDDQRQHLVRSAATKVEAVMDAQLDVRTEGYQHVPPDSCAC